jgi:hypothetical protein
VSFVNVFTGLFLEFVYGFLLSDGVFIESLNNISIEEISLIEVSSDIIMESLLGGSEVSVSSGDGCEESCNNSSRLFHFYWLKVLI